MKSVSGLWSRVGTISRGIERITFQKTFILHVGDTLLEVRRSQVPHLTAEVLLRPAEVSTVR